QALNKSERLSRKTGPFVLSVVCRETLTGSRTTSPATLLNRRREDHQDDTTTHAPRPAIIQ
ncbi:hypothetical protein, partial [Raoultella planticola]|uniref:hypothetical protein n=1 Tax=Raoultella planticola TaxID=575 RepID=UPI0019810557